MKLSLCMIARNEAKNITEAINSVQGAVDEIVLVDTGSTDGTSEIARGLGAQVVNIPWENDFSQARNAAIERATGDWILILDADERFSVELVGKLREVIQNHPDGLGVMMPIRNTINGSQSVVIHWRVSAFRNDPRLRYVGRVHETIGPAIQKAGGILIKVDLPVTHHGYGDLNSVIDKTKGRNLDLLKMGYEEDPDNYIYSFYLGKSYLTAFDDCVKARFYLEQTIELCKNFPSVRLESLFYLGMVAEKEGKLGEALQRWQQVLTEDVHFPDVYYVLGFIYYREKRFKVALPFFEQALRCDVRLSNINIHNFMFTNARILEQIQECLAVNGDYVKCIQYRMKEEVQ